MVEVLDALEVWYYFCGSVASSAHGVARASIDVDLVADLRPEHVGPFVARLQGTYYVDEGRVRSAVQLRRSFNLIHLTTMFKVDVFAARPGFDQKALERARPMALDESGRAQFFVASPEDTVLAKLEWFRAGGEVSERQWSDVAGVLKILPGADRDHLRRWAHVLKVSDLLERALSEADAGRKRPHTRED